MSNNKFSIIRHKQIIPNDLYSRFRGEILSQLSYNISDGHAYNMIYKLVDYIGMFDEILEEVK